MPNYRYEILKYRDKFYMWLTGALPADLVLWCYIAVCSNRGDCPDPMYSLKYKQWVEDKDIRTM